ncbi:tRNA (guanosine(37)-N1)-methyltransferase TrmD [Thiomicrospira sp. ALE5]|uniref:tRNA (guanosine(37)-N1)-methyltransferase TrmD n=1 Tax=Thiomicrospira sp. ALE5 TaxID=748650 RepID=UPI0008EB9EB0|nr:tRNA (guanosine(37)-N1)-methyltransferase TrmD [Thiomicrospira sp. ALE5]SFR59626.1 tRNA (guanine37-N1)-methyltransferase [Thiomicrospira sp. ALE5]
MLRFDVISIFGEMFTALTAQGISAKALEKGLYKLAVWNPRDFTHDKHRTIDDRPYGGGPGMLMMYEPLRDTFKAINQQQPEQPSHTIYLSPQGKPLTQQRVVELATFPRITLLCGRYEGVDERVIENFVDEEIAIGDFVVSGGELPAMMLMDAIIRLQPGALGHQDSARQDSFSDGLLDCPHYTRPEVIDGKAVPPVLMSGNHAHIVKWRQQQQWQRTQARRPDLLKN